MRNKKNSGAWRPEFGFVDEPKLFFQFVNGVLDNAFV